MRVGRARRVGRVVAGDRLEQDGVVLDRAGDRPDMVEREGERKDAVAAHRPIGRLHPDHAATGGGIAHRSAGVGAERRRRHAGRGRGPASARRATGMEVGVPRVAGGRPGQLQGRAAIGEFMQRQLAEQDGASLAQAPDHRGVRRGAVADAQLGVAGGGQAVDVENVLQRVGHAVHRAAPSAARDLGFRGLGLAARDIGCDRYKCVVGRVNRRDAVEQRLGERDRRKLAAADQA